jgi:Fe-S-cluster-containing dehydrogenase component
MARIRVVKIEAEGLDEPHVCRRCQPAPCVEACANEALHRDDVTGAVLLKDENCVGCSDCVEACPFGMATLDPQAGLALICDLCGGDPACVKRCATGAIVFGEVAAQTEGGGR